MHPSFQVILWFICPRFCMSCFVSRVPCIVIQGDEGTVTLGVPPSPPPGGGYRRAQLVLLSKEGGGGGGLHQCFLGFRFWVKVVCCDLVENIFHQSYNLKCPFCHQHSMLR